MLEAFESQMRVCLFEYRQISGHFCIHRRREGVALLLWAFKVKDAWFLWLEEPGVRVISPWEVTPFNTTAYTEVAPSRGDFNQDKKNQTNQLLLDFH